MRRASKEHFMLRVMPEPNTGCWLWIGEINKHGYGIAYSPQGMQLGIGRMGAHRLSYLYHKRAIPEGLVLDHLCRTPLCVNPDHLEPVTSKENIYRGIGEAAKNIKKTHCQNGHSFEDENLFIVKKDGKKKQRLCRICHLERGRKHELKRAGTRDWHTYNSKRKYKQSGESI